MKLFFVCLLFPVALSAANLEQWEIDGLWGKELENVSHLTTSLYLVGGDVEDDMEGSKWEKFSTT